MTGPPCFRSCSLTRGKPNIRDTSHHFGRCRSAASLQGLITLIAQYEGYERHETWTMLPSASGTSLFLVLIRLLRIQC